MSGQHNKLIERHNSDNSAETKAVTYFGEIEDFAQFTVMTGLGDGVDAVAHHAYGHENLIPMVGLAGLDVFAYGVMFHLAQMREEKFRQRRGYLNDQNQTEYYTALAEALYAAMDASELVSLNNDMHTINGITDQKALIIHLIKHNAAMISPDNLPAARTMIFKWNAIFEKAKKRPAFSAYLFTQDSLKKLPAIIETDQHFDSPLDNLHNKNFKTLEHEWVSKVLNRFSTRRIGEDDVTHFINHLTFLEKSHSNDEIKEKQKSLLESYGVPKHKLKDALQYLESFYSIYHDRRDLNDKAFYKANLRGIQSEEDFRTSFKVQLFKGVKTASFVSLLYSLSVFGTSLVYELTKHQPLSFAFMVGPLFLVGATSLVDEASDIYFKNKKYWQSKKDVDLWESSHADIMTLFPHLLSPKHQSMTDFIHDENNEAKIHDYYLGARKDGEDFDKEKFGKMFLLAKYQEHKELTDRLSRRGTKLFQAACSFTGVFFGVLISWAVAILTLVNVFPTLISTLSFAGFATIGMAAVAGGVMVKYQMGQNNNKIKQADDAYQLETKSLVGSSRHFPTIKKDQDMIETLGLESSQLGSPQLV